MLMRFAKALLLTCLAAALTACPPTGIVCRAGTDLCGQGCIDPQSDKRNCGGCGIPCGTNQDCSQGVCACATGATDCSATGSGCAVITSDARNCGACGHACGTNQVCEASQCKVSCTLGVLTACSGACVNLQSDGQHCGDCLTVCGTGQRCRAGRCGSDVIAACFTSGQVVGVETQSYVRGPRQALGTGPAALAAYGDSLFAADGIDKRLYQATLAPALAQYAQWNRTGSVPNQVLVDPPYVYLVNAESGTLQVLKRDAPVTAGDVGVDDGGLTGGIALATVAELPLGTNSWPEGLAKLGTSLWIPLYGGFGATAAADGQKVLEVDVTTPESPQVINTVDLSTLDLHAFDGGTPMPRPWAIAAHQGALYVALNNLNPDTYVAEGPGMLARIEPSTRAVTGIDLGWQNCLNPQWVASDGHDLAVSCGGAAQYDSNYALLGSEHAGVVLVSRDLPAAAWTAACPDAGTCAPILPGRFAFSQGRVFLADQNAGRLFVLEVTDGGLTERLGYAGTTGSALEVCAPDLTTGVANVADVLALP
jgi:hypothetical protein